jgi:hypothetical protein
MLMMWVATKYKPAPDEEGLAMLGVLGKGIGKRRMGYCGERSIHETGKVCTFILRPDQVFMREIVRGKIIFSMHFLRCMLRVIWTSRPWGITNLEYGIEGSETLVMPRKMMMNVAMMSRPLMRKTNS